ncbi:MAG: transglutaminase domain-containing protein [Phycisphaerales bacterium]|nr:transglutaminase domain-containing protein [Phycisphaerales bacterium]
MSNRILVLATCLLALCAPTLRARALDESSDRWYELWIEGSRSGWQHETVSEADGRITTTVEMHLGIKRADQTMEITQKSEFQESMDGKPLRVSLEQRLGPTPISSVYEFQGTTVSVSSTQEGAARTQTLPMPPGDWLPPAAAARYVRQRLLSGAGSITVRTLDPSNGLVISTTTRSEIVPTEVDALGRKVAGYRATGQTKVGSLAVPSTEWFDDAGTLVRAETSIGAMKMTQVASTRARALEEAEFAELMVSTFVKPNRSIPAPRQLQKARYRVSLNEGAIPDVPSGASQSGERVDEATIDVHVDLSMHQSAGEVNREAYLAATTYADKEDQVVAALTTQALQGVRGDDHARAEALRRFVYRHIKQKDLGVAFATASETARTGEGDCSEHGVLLAGMLRAAGIPSRVAAGVVYVDSFSGARGVFGYHMWTQALLDGPNGPEWVDEDATLGGTTPFDAAHIAFATSDLAEGETVSALAGIAPLLGTLRIEVLD